MNVKELCIDEIHCHHKIPKFLGGTDDYFNLIIIHKEVHKLIHAISMEIINASLNQIKPTKIMLGKINELREKVGNEIIRVS